MDSINVDVETPPISERTTQREQKQKVKLYCLLLFVVVVDVLLQWSVIFNQWRHLMMSFFNSHYV